MSEVPNVLGQSYDLYPLKWTKAAHLSPPPQNKAKTKESEGLRIGGEKWLFGLNFHFALELA